MHEFIFPTSNLIFFAKAKYVKVAKIHGNELQEILEHLFLITTSLTSKVENQQLEVKIKDEQIEMKV